jgi:hypothetical protein
MELVIIHVFQYQAERTNFPTARPLYESRAHNIIKHGKTSTEKRN